MRLLYNQPTAAFSRGAPGVFPVQVIRHEVIAPDVVTLSLAQPGTTHTPGPFLPGQFITLAIPGPEGVLYRSYSLCGMSDPRAPLEITLKRVPGGLVSHYLFETVKVGMILHILPPRGTFLLPPVLHAEQTLIFVAVGSGITPINSFLHTLAALPPGSRPTAHLHYASRSPHETIYRRELLQLDWLQQTHYLKTEGVRMTPSQIIAHSSPFLRETHWYICGPEAFTFQLRDTLLSAGFPHQAIHFETFTSQARQQRTHQRTHLPAQAVVGQLAIQETGAILDVRAQETLLEALERQGYQPEYGCRAGSCGACRLRVLRGPVHYPGTAVLTAAEIQEGFVLGCTAQPQGNVLLETGGIPPRGLPGGTRQASTRRNTQQYRLRLVAAALICLLTAGLWQLTDHKVSASSSSPSSSRSIPHLPSSTATAPPATTITLPATPATGSPGSSQVVPTPTPAPIPTTVTASS